MTKETKAIFLMTSLTFLLPMLLIALFTALASVMSLSSAFLVSMAVTLSIPFGIAIYAGIKLVREKNRNVKNSNYVLRTESTNLSWFSSNFRINNIR